MRCTQCKKKIQEGEEMKIKLSTIHKECLQEYIGKHIEKVSVDRKKNERNFKKAVQKNEKAKRMKVLWDELSVYIRLRDADKDGFCTCICCGKRQFWKSGRTGMAAGHYKAASSSMYLKLHEDNISAQCYTCNEHYSNNTMADYRKNLVKKIGIERVEHLEEAKRRRTVRKITLAEVNDLIKKYRAKNKELTSRV